MILAGDIGATRTRLAAFETEGNRLQCVVEKTYMSQEHGGLVGNSRAVHHAPKAFPCIAHASGWLDQCAQDEARFLICRGSSIRANWRSNSNYNSVGLLNDLEAYAYGIDALESKDFITLSEGSEDAEGNRAVISARTGLGVAGLYWDGFRHHPFACEGGHADFAPRSDTSDGIAGLPPEEIRPRQLRANSFGTGYQEHLRVSSRYTESRRTGVVARTDQSSARCTGVDLASSRWRAKPQSAIRRCRFSSVYSELRLETVP